MKILLALILTGQFMAVLDASIVNVAIPTIRVDLQASGSDLQLIVAGYVIAYAVLLITGARLGMRFGFRTAFLVGLTIFTVASLACGIAPTSQILIVVRAIQGGGAALMVPQVFSLIQRNFTGSGAGPGAQPVGGDPGPRRPRRPGARRRAGQRGPLRDRLATGLPGQRADRHRPAAGVAPHTCRSTCPGAPRPLDLAGLLSLAAAVLLLVVPLVLGHEQGWPAWTYASLVAERRRDRRLRPDRAAGRAQRRRAADRRARPAGAGHAGGARRDRARPGRVRRLPVHLHPASPGRPARLRPRGRPDVRAAGRSGSPSRA